MFDQGRRFIARGYYNPASSIPVRVLTRDPEQQVDRAFLIARIREAHELRLVWLDTKTTDAHRVVHGESDSVPGLIVDRYADFLVVQFHTLGMDRLQEVVVEALLEVIGPTGIYKRSDVGTRRLAGAEDGVFPGPAGELAGRPVVCPEPGGAELFQLFRGVFRLCGPGKGIPGGERGCVGTRLWTWPGRT